jgi:hypothetical protein
MMSQKTPTKAAKTLLTDLRGRSVVTSTCGSRPKRADLNPENAFRCTFGRVKKTLLEWWGAKTK